LTPVNVSVLAVAPEQAAVWAYPQPSFTDDEISFAMCSALLGRIHLSGHIDQMSQRQHGMVTEAVEVYKAIRADLAEAVPFWPLGLPCWTDPASHSACGHRAPPTWRPGAARPADHPGPGSPPASPFPSATSGESRRRRKSCTRGTLAPE
jgi:hypothetical protein